MSKRKKRKGPGKKPGPPPNNPDATSVPPKRSKGINDLFLRQDGLETAGGCDSCDAIQKLTTVSGGVFYVEERHDDWCPEWQRRQQIAGRR